MPVSSISNVALSDLQGATGPSRTPLQAPTPQHDTLGTPFFGGPSDAFEPLDRQQGRDGISAYQARSAGNRGNRPEGGRVALKSAACRGAIWSMPPSWRSSSGSSDPGSTRTRSSLGPSSSAAVRSLGCGSIRKSPLESCGGLARSRRLIRPPARVSGRISLRTAEEAECNCFRSTGRGRTNRLRRLR